MLEDDRQDSPDPTYCKLIAGAIAERLQRRIAACRTGNFLLNTQNPIVIDYNPPLTDYLKDKSNEKVILIETNSLVVFCWITCCLL
jgi:hypothetical protein